MRGDYEMAGRPTAGQPSNSLNARIDLDLKRRLEDAARDAGRSLAQEVERRLAASFDDAIQVNPEHPTGILFNSLRQAIKTVEETLQTEWWKNPNASTVFEGAASEIVSRLAKPLDYEPLYRNRLMRATNGSDPTEQDALRKEFLADGAAIGRLATQTAFERRNARAEEQNSGPRQADDRDKPSRKRQD